MTQTMHPKVPLSLEDAHKIIQSAHAKAAAHGLRVSVAIVDEGGHLIALARMDGAIPLSPAIAEAKAVGAAMFQRDGASLLSMAEERPIFFEAVGGMTRLRVVAGPGSLPIKRNGVVVGAVGVSGARPDQDLECAEAGLTSILS